MLVHAPKAEREFVEGGWGVGRRQVMYNDFVILGPASGPAGIDGSNSAAAAMKRIAASQSMFVSRGDRSGTHAKEKELWRQAGIQPAGGWYRSVGKGMGETLTIANEMQAYVLADRGTYIKFRDKIGLIILVAGDEALHNPYGVIAVNPAKHPHVKYNEAMKLIEFLTSDDGRAIIGGYKMDGEVLFHPWPKASESRTGAAAASES